MDSPLAVLLAKAEVAAGETDALVDRLLAREAESVTAALLAGSTVQSRHVIEERLAAYRATVAIIRDMARAMGLASLSPEIIWDVYLSLAQHLIRVRPNAGSCFLVAIIGGPGAGKTTLTRILEMLLRHGFGLAAASISSDDFYLPREERLRRGLRWRGAIESHDIDALRNVLSALRESRELRNVPRFDIERDDRIGFESVSGPLDVCLFEGWTTAALLDRLDGAAAQSIDYTIFLKANVEFLKRSRLEKEALIRARSANQRGLPPAEMQSFWDIVIAPGLERYVMPFEESADLTIHVGADHRIATVANG